MPVKVQTAVVSQQGDLVNIQVFPEFYGLCVARQDATLWPERTCDSYEPNPQTNVRSWVWRFPSEAEATAFATAAKAKIAHWETVLLGPN